VKPVSDSVKKVYWLQIWKWFRNRWKLSYEDSVVCLSWTTFVVYC